MSKLKERQVPPPPVWVNSVSLIQDRLWKQYNALYLYGADYWTEMSNEDRENCEHDPDYMKIVRDTEKVLNIIHDLDVVAKDHRLEHADKVKHRKELVKELGYDPHINKLFK